MRSFLLDLAHALYQCGTPTHILEELVGGAAHGLRVRMHILAGRRRC